MAIIGHKIAAACDDGTVGIYDSITGALKLSLSPGHPVKAVAGSPDGSMLFCTHERSPSITMWDVQTGGLIHTFPLKSQVKATAISLNGRYLACGLTNGSVNVWEVANRMECPAFGNGWPVMHLCWLEPEERLAVVDAVSLRIWGVITGMVLYTFRMPDPVCGTTYSQKLNQLAIATSSGAESIITTIDLRTGTSSASCRIQQRLSCLAFSRTTKELVCGMQTHGLQLFNIPMKRWRQFDHPATITSVSTLSNGTVVVNAAGSGIQLLSLDSGYAPSRQPITPALTVHPADQERIITIVPTTHDHIILLEIATMRQLTRIPAQGDRVSLANHTVIPCASLVKLMAVYCFIEGGKKNLQLWKFGHQLLPEWTVETDELPPIARISPRSARLVTFHVVHDKSYFRIRDMGNGGLLANLLLDHPVPPLDVTFDSEDLFYSLHETHRILYVFVTPSAVPVSESGTPNHLITCKGQVPLASQPWKREFFVDDSHEWVVSGSQRICWIPPGYIGSAQGSYCWVGSTLVMAGQDGTLRKFIF